MDKDMMYEYLVNMGAMQPEYDELERRQKQIDALRESGLNAPKGQMVGNYYVAPSFTQYAAQLGQAYAAGQGQKEVDRKMSNPAFKADMPVEGDNMPGLVQKQMMMLDALRRKKKQTVMPSGAYTPSVNANPYGGIPTYGDEA